MKKINIYNELLPRASAGCAMAMIGVFLSLRLKAFILSVWGADLGKISLLGIIALFGLAGLLFAHPILRWGKEWLALPRQTKCPYISLAAIPLAMGILWMNRDFLLFRMLDHAEVTVSGLFPLGYALGGGILLTVFLLCTISAGRESLQKAGLFLRGFNRWDGAFLALTILVVNILVLLYAKNSETIYFWDNAGYWTVSHDLAELWQTDGLAALLKTARDSVLTHDYNYLIILPILPWVRMFGASRAVFLLAIANVWLIPVCILVWAAAKWMMAANIRPQNAVYAASIALLALPMLLYMTFTGFVDVGGCVFTLSALLLRETDRGRNGFGRFFLAGLFLAAAVLLRRWFAFFALAYVLALAVDCLIFRRSAVPFLGTLSAFAFTLLFFFQELVSGKLMADYGAMYSAYSLGLGKDFLLLFRYFGILMLLIVLACGIYCLIGRESRASGGFLLMQSVLCFLLFARVQTHGQQHLLLYAPACLTLLLLTFAHMPKRKIVAPLAAVCALTAMLSPFLPRVQPSSLEELTRPALLPSFTWTPPAREDAHTIVELVRRLDEFGAEGQNVGVLASSFIINYDILLNAEASLSLPRISDVDRGYLAVLPAVDQRDGWADTIFFCDIVVAADPVQLHLGRENQAVVALPAEEILAGEGIGAAFERLDEHYVLQDGVTVYLYRRVRDITWEEMVSIREKYLALHPEASL